MAWDYIYFRQHLSPFYKVTTLDFIYFTFTTSIYSLTFSVLRHASLETLQYSNHGGPGLHLLEAKFAKSFPTSIFSGRQVGGNPLSITLQPKGCYSPIDYFRGNVIRECYFVALSRLDSNMRHNN